MYEAKDSQSGGVKLVMNSVFSDIKQKILIVEILPLNITENG